MIHKIKKQISVFAALAIILSLFSFISVSAEGELPINIGISISSSVEKNGAYVGNIIKPVISLDFDNAFSVESKGLYFINFGFRFDPDKLEIIDPNTLEPIEFDEMNNPVSGSIFKDCNLGEISGVLSAKLNKDMRTIVLNYGSTSAATDIHEYGDLAEFAFRVKEDLTVNNSSSMVFEIIPDMISCNNKDVVLNVTGDKRNVFLTPPYKFSYLGETKIGNTINLTITEYIDENSEYPLIFSIKKGDEVVKEIDVPLTSIYYREDILFNENEYEPGEYTFNMSYYNTSRQQSFTLAEKYVPPTPVEPDEPDEPDTPTEPDTDNGEEDNTNPGTTTNPGTGTGTGGGTGIPTTKPGADDNSDKDDKDEDKPVVDNKPTAYYPSDTKGHWADNSIKYVYDNSLMNGYEDGTFGPELSITRAEFSTVMARLLGLAEAPDKAEQFADSASHWAKGYIGALADAGIVGGVADGEFAPDDNITREQIAVILSRALKLTDVAESKYNDDALISDWAYDDVYKVFAAGYMKGDTENNFNPAASATRAEVATIIYRLHSSIK